MTKFWIYGVVTLGLLTFAWHSLGVIYRYWHPIEMRTIQLLLLIGVSIFFHLNAKKRTLTWSLIVAVSIGMLINLFASVVVAALFTVDGMATNYNMFVRPIKMIVGLLFMTFNTPALYVCVLLATLAHILSRDILNLKK